MGTTARTIDTETDAPYSATSHVSGRPATGFLRVKTSRAARTSSGPSTKPRDGPAQTGQLTNAASLWIEPPTKQSRPIAVKA